jgi:isopenicillin N synthase-like dioxygenase
MRHCANQNDFSINLWKGKWRSSPVLSRMSMLGTIHLSTTTAMVGSTVVGLAWFRCAATLRLTMSQDLMEAFNWGYEAIEDPEAVDTSAIGKSIWPSDLPGFREGLYAYHTRLLQLARRLTRTFALALHLPENYFDEYIKQPEAGMRIAYYPQQEHSPDHQQGIGAHTDVECFTIVTQDDSGGLEVLSKAGNWIRANPIPGSFVVNIADCFMRQTNDFFVSTVHRVINKSGKERYSAPFFFGFDRSKMLQPVPTCVSEENPQKYPNMTCGEYYLWRTNTKKNSGKVQV